MPKSVLPHRPARRSLWRAGVLALAAIGLLASGCGVVDCCANWTCNGDPNCASVMGGYYGQQCGLGDVGSCDAWCQQYIPGGCSCSC